jgi:hypothetical protein
MEIGGGVSQSRRVGRLKWLGSGRCAMTLAA